MFKKVAFIVASAGALVGQVYAAVPAAVSTGVTEAGTDGGTIVGLMAAAGAGIYLLAKVLRKFGVML